MARGLGVGLYKRNSVLNILGPRTNMLYLLELTQIQNKQVNYCKSSIKYNVILQLYYSCLTLSSQPEIVNSTVVVL